MKKRVAVLISGRGSNMMSLVEAARDPAYPAEIVLVISNRQEAAGLVWATQHGVTAVCIDHKLYENRMAFEARMHQTLLEHRIDLVCNAGFMRLLTAGFVERWYDRHLNIHPSLLPLFPGLDTHQRVLDHGPLITGCTVHMVRTEMDSGPILGQAAVPIIPGDTAETLAERVLMAEHKLYPHVLRLVASGAVKIINSTVVFSGEHPAEPPLYAPALPRPAV